VDDKTDRQLGRRRRHVEEASHMTSYREHTSDMRHGRAAVEAGTNGVPAPESPVSSTSLFADSALVHDAQVDAGAALAGDRRAIERLLVAIRPLVVRYCRVRVGRQERSFTSADDVAQEVLLAVLTALPRYREEGRPFLSFVYRIAAHKVADAHRRAAANRSESVPEVPDVPETEAGPEQRVVQGELAEHMTRLLLILSEKQREIVVLRVVMGLSTEETAEAVGSTPGAVRVAQHRALAKLRRALTGAGISDEAVFRHEPLGS
jgi:RNA polymerase sigma-70 factor (ECF subfamily)